MNQANAEYDKQVLVKYGSVIEQMQVTETEVQDKQDFLRDIQHLRKVFGNFLCLLFRVKEHP